MKGPWPGMTCPQQKRNVRRTAGAHTLRLSGGRLPPLAEKRPGRLAWHARLAQAAAEAGPALG